MAEGGKSKGVSVAGLILGIASILCCAVPCLNFVLGLVGLILSIVGKKKNKDGLSTGGLITSIIGIVGSLLIILLWLIIIIANIYSASK